MDNIPQRIYWQGPEEWIIYLNAYTGRVLRATGSTLFFQFQAFGVLQAQHECQRCLKERRQREKERGREREKPLDNFVDRGRGDSAYRQTLEVLVCVSPMRQQ